jgi:hypothetical protein
MIKRIKRLLCCVGLHNWEYNGGRLAAIHINNPLHLGYSRAWALCKRCKKAAFYCGTSGTNNWTFDFDNYQLVTHETIKEVQEAKSIKQEYERLKELVSLQEKSENKVLSRYRSLDD